MWPKKLGNGPTTAFSLVAMWLARNTQSCRRLRSTRLKSGSIEFLCHVVRAIFRRAANPRLGRILAA
jgi:hypothetical protein